MLSGDLAAKNKVLFTLPSGRFLGGFRSLGHQLSVIKFTTIKKRAKGAVRIIATNQSRPKFCSRVLKFFAVGSGALLRDNVNQKVERGKNRSAISGRLTDGRVHICLCF